MRGWPVAGGRLWTRNREFCGEGGGEDSALANHWLQNEINTALNENVSMWIKFSFLACTGRLMYSSICLSKVCTEKQKNEISGALFTEGFAPLLCLFWLIPEWLRAAYFVSGFRQKGEMFSKIAHEMAGLPETGFEEGQRHRVGILWRVSGRELSSVGVCACHLHILR